MLNVPQNFLNGFVGKASSVYPIVIIRTGDKTIRLSQIKGVFDGEYYEDRFLVVDSISEKINIQEKSFQVNQVKIKVSNYIISQVRFSEKFKNFSFTNAEVDIYYANKACKTLEECLHIFKGFVKSYEGDKESVSFNIEDHSQYTLDQKNLPKHSTVDPEAETVEESKDVYFPMVYGHVEKSPMIFSKGVNGTVFSQIYPEAIMYGVKIKGIVDNIDNPLSMFRDDMYLPVPEVFRDLPEDFFVNGYDYSKYNGTRQYDISPDRNWIQLEKKSTDFNSSYLLPLNVAARDQFQVDVSRPVTGISADTSAGEGDDDTGNYLNYGDAGGIRYLGRADGFEPYGENNDWLFPFPSGQLKMGYYQDFVLGGIVRKWRKYYNAAGGGSGQDSYLYGESSHACLYYHMATSTPTADGIKGFDMVYLPMPEGEGQTELIQYFNEDYIQENNIVEINWKMGDSLVDAYDEDPDFLPQPGNAYGGLWNGHSYADFDPDNSSGFPEDSDWFALYQTGTVYKKRKNWYQYLWGVELKNSNGEVVDVIGIDNQNLGENNEGVSLDLVIKPEVYAWINVLDAQFNEEGNNEEMYPELQPDSVINLRKLLWGRKVTVAESNFAFNPADESLNPKSIPTGSSVYGLYPCLGYNVPKASDKADEYYTEHNPFANGYQWRFEHFELVVDNLFSYKNPYLLNPQDPIGDYRWDNILFSLEKFNYNQLNTPEEQNRLVITKHDSEKSYINNQDTAGRIAFYGNQPFEFVESVADLPTGPEPDIDHAYQASNIVSAGIEKVNGGNWCPINNTEGKKDLVKLDLTFQSLSGDDVVLGGVYSKIRGKITVDLWKVPSDQEYQGAAGDMPTFRVQCDALHKNEDEVVYGADIFNLPDTETDDNGEPSNEGDIQHYSTGDPGFGFNTSEEDAESGITFDENDPQYFNTDCTAYEDEDEDQWRENINSLNTISLYYDIDAENLSNECETTTTTYFKTNIKNFTLDQRYIVANASHQKYFANIEGRVDNADGRYTGVEDLDEQQLIKRPSDIIMHIMERELDYYNVDSFDQESIEQARSNHGGWKFGFSITEKTPAKEFIADFAKSTKLIPRFRHNGTFGFINIFESYNGADAVINAADVSKFKYSKIPMEVLS